MIYGNVYKENGTIIRQPLYDGLLTDADCKTKFIALMTAKAALLGMASTTYVSPSGQTTDNVSTAQDELKLGIAVCGNKDAMEIWHTPSRSFSVYGSNPRTISVTNNVIGSESSATDLQAYYKLLGGKGGSLNLGGTYYHRAEILCVEVKGRPAMLAVMAYGETPYNNIFKSCKELADMIADAIDGETPTAGTNLTALITAGGGYAGCVVPNIPAVYNFDYSATDFAARTDVIKDGQTTSRKSASTSKTMTMMCALDYIRDFDATITVKSADIESGSGSTFYDGDILRVGDALRIMMMESSNTMANAIARSVGGYVLQLG